MDNPYMDNDLIDYDKINPAEIFDKVSTIIALSKEEVDTLSKSNENPTWENFVLLLDEISDKIQKILNPINHMKSVRDCKELRSEYQRCIPMLTDYGIFIGQNTRLYSKFIQMRDGDGFDDLTLEQQKSIHDNIQEFELSGIALGDEEKVRYKEISERLSVLGENFSDNALDAKNAWTKHITDIDELGGLPTTNLDILKSAADEKELDGWLITLDAPNFSSIMEYAHNRDLRKEVSYASQTKASEIGPNAGEFDNRPIMDEILALEFEQSKLLSFDNPAELSVATKMADSGSEVLEFLDSLLHKCKDKARVDKDELDNYGQDILGLDKVHGYDRAYIFELIRKEKYALDEEEIRQYFPAPSVIDGLFKLVNTLYDISIVEHPNVSVWHDSVKFYDVMNASGEHIASFYFDLYTRSTKRGGAWMNDAQIRFRQADGTIQKPIAYLNCNFPPPTSKKPSLLTHNDVETLFHEFGHGLHHMLTETETYDVSGINGVEWDAVELPSQIMENWCWNEDVIEMMSSHVETSVSMPKELFDKMIAAKNFYSGAYMLRQVSMSRMDMKLYSEYDVTNPNSFDEIIKENEDYVGVFERAEHSRWENTFSHIFAGGYSAGYYSYKWAEVLSADAFSMFEENGILDPVTGAKFRECILAKGATKPAMDLFVDFRGREPSPDALLRHNGII